MFVQGKALVIAVTFFLVFLCGTSHGRNTIPKRLYDILTGANSTDDFLKSIDKTVYAKMKAKNLIPNKLTLTLKSRSSGSSSQSSAVMTDLDQQPCMLREYIHFLDQPAVQTNSFIWPFAIKIPRCIGSCNVHPNELQCAAINSTEIVFYAYEVRFSASRKRREVMEEFSRDPDHHIAKRNSEPQTVHPIQIKVDKHLECGCKCTVNKTFCQATNKTFNKDYCRCECPVVHQCSHPHKWDDDQCKCVCPVPELEGKNKCYEENRKLLSKVYRGFNTGKVWSSDACDCLCDVCPSQYVQDPRTCACRCRRRCPSGYRLNRRRCTCISRG